MKKFLKKIMVPMLVLAMAVSMMIPAAFAVTPSLTPPSIPDISDIEFDFSNLGFNKPESDGTEEGDIVIEDGATAPTLPGTPFPAPEIIKACYFNGGFLTFSRNRLQISWGKNERIQTYEIEITKADGTVLTYTSSSDSLTLNNFTCPRVYNKETRTWSIGTVRIRGEAHGTYSGWCNPVQIVYGSMY